MLYIASSDSYFFSTMGQVSENKSARVEIFRLSYVLEVVRSSHDSCNEHQVGQGSLAIVITQSLLLFLSVRSIDLIPLRLPLKIAPTRILMLREYKGESFSMVSGQNYIDTSSQIYLQRKIWRLFRLF